MTEPYAQLNDTDNFAVENGTIDELFRRSFARKPEERSDDYDDYIDWALSDFVAFMSEKETK